MTKIANFCQFFAERWFGGLKRRGWILGWVAKTGQRRSRASSTSRSRSSGKPSPKPGVLARASPGRRLGSIPTPSVSLAPSLRGAAENRPGDDDGQGKSRGGDGRGDEEEAEASAERTNERTNERTRGPSFLPLLLHPQ